MSGESDAYVDHNWYDCLRCGYPQNPPAGYKGATCTCDTPTAQPRAQDRAKDLDPRGVRGPRHGEPGAYPDFLEPDSLIEVVATGPRGGYTPDQGKEGEGQTWEPTPNEDPIIRLKNWAHGWMSRRHWAIRHGVQALRWATVTFARGSMIVASGLLAVLEAVYARPAPRRRRKRRAGKAGWRTAHDYRGGRFPRKKSKSKSRRDDDWSEENE